MYSEKIGRVHERRRKRMVVPAIYFAVEVVLVWLILSLVQLEFNLFKWDIWEILVFIPLVFYSTFKTIHIYRRQKSYPTTKDKE